jgi:hypothetical protein
MPLMGKNPEHFSQIPTMTWTFWGIAALILFRSLVLKKY